MSHYSPKEMRAIAYYSERHDLRVQLSTYPTIYFLRKDNGQEVSRQISGIVSEYEQYKKEESLEKARVKREEDRRAKSNTPYRDQYR